MTDPGGEPPAHLNGEGYRRLVVVKQVLASAVSRSYLEGRSARMLALIDFDFSVETLLRFAHRALRPREQVPANFPTLLKAVHSALQADGGAGIAEFSEIERMHTMRNGVQHHAEYPTSEQVIRVRSAASLCVRQATLDVWGEDLDSIDEIELVATPGAKELLLNAKEWLLRPEPDFYKAVAYCWKALSAALDVVSAALLGVSTREPGMSVVLSGDFDRTYTDRGLYESIHNSQALTLMLTFGIDPVRYLRYRRVTGTIYRLAGTDSVMRTVTGTDDEIAPEDAHYVYGFCLDSVLQMENGLGELTLPRWEGGLGGTQRRIEL